MSDAAKRPGSYTMLGIRMRSYGDEKCNAREVLRMANGFRQEHAHRVWQAVQAALAVVGASFAMEMVFRKQTKLVGETLMAAGWVRPRLDSNASDGRGPGSGE